MREVCAMTGVIFNPERPGQSIRELKAAGIEGVMFDFGIFAAPAGVLHDRGICLRLPGSLLQIHKQKRNMTT